MRILELLKADPSPYVQKSVANNLNDISKTHPELVLETARRWQGQNPVTDWILKDVYKRQPFRMAMPTCTGSHLVADESSAIRQKSSMPAFSKTAGVS